MQYILLASIGGENATECVFPFNGLGTVELIKLILARLNYPLDSLRA